MIAVQIAADAGFDDWRVKARALIAAKAAPDVVTWRREGALDLFGECSDLLPTVSSLHVPRAFMAVAEKAAMHSDPERFAVLYRLLWRLQTSPGLMTDAADKDVARVQALAKAVARDLHKMHAFVRFREIADERGPKYVAWFEPQYYITRAVADFFVKRFAGMRWSIITPEASLHWDGADLVFAPGGARSDVPTEDARDADWRTYYESMFNPSRLKVRAMQKEMPKLYWRNLPEAASISQLIRDASTRADAMVQAKPSTPKKRAGHAHARIRPADVSDPLKLVAGQTAPPDSIGELNQALAACRACPLWCGATQVVASEGRKNAPLLALVGEQPGDTEDLAGRPFVGPAGRVLDRALRAAGIAREDVFLTNSVKHFKHEVRGKRRLHKRPNKSEIETCRWWVKHELALVKPKHVVALGVTALQSLSAHQGALNIVRGAVLKTREGLSLQATIHPAALLRLPDDADAEAEFAHFVSDLRKAAQTAQDQDESSSVTTVNPTSGARP